MRAGHINLVIVQPCDRTDMVARNSASFVKATILSVRVHPLQGDPFETEKRGGQIPTIRRLSNQIMYTTIQIRMQENILICVTASSRQDDVHGRDLAQADCPAEVTGMIMVKMGGYPTKTKVMSPVCLREQTRNSEPLSGLIP